MTRPEPPTALDLKRLADRADRLDAADGLASLRDRFLLPDGVAYLDGNSLARFPPRCPAP